MRTHLKTLVLVAIILGTILIFAPNKVEATSISTVTGGTITENSLDNIPNTISLDIKESEVKKVPELIMNKITTELNTQGITLKENFTENSTFVNVWFGTLNNTIPNDDLLPEYMDMIFDIHKVNIKIVTKDNTCLIKKEVTIKYNNSADYNENDRVYVKNLIEKDIKGKTFEIYNKPNQNQDLLEILNKKINNPNIKVIYNGTGEHDIEYSKSGIMFFKNDVYYQTISVTAYNYYLTSDVNIGNNIIVSGLLENVSINVTEKDNAEMKSKVYETGYPVILGSYELTLTGATSLVSPIDITFNVGAKYNGLKTYILHKKADGTYEKFEEKVQDGKVTITVSELSPFVIAVKENDQTPTTDNTETKTDTIPTTNKGEKDTTPKTATTDIIGYVLGATILSGMGIIALKKRI